MRGRGRRDEVEVSRLGAGLVKEQIQGQVVHPLSFYAITYIDMPIIFN